MDLGNLLNFDSLLGSLNFEDLLGTFNPGDLLGFDNLFSFDWITQVVQAMIGAIGF